MNKLPFFFIRNFSFIAILSACGPGKKDVKLEEVSPPRSLPPSKPEIESSSNEKTKPNDQNSTENADKRADTYPELNLGFQPAIKVTVASKGLYIHRKDGSLVFYGTEKNHPFAAVQHRLTKGVKSFGIIKQPEFSFLEEFLQF